MSIYGFTRVEDIARIAEAVRWYERTYLDLASEPEDNTRVYPVWRMVKVTGALLESPDPMAGYYPAQLVRRTQAAGWIADTRPDCWLEMPGTTAGVEAKSPSYWPAILQEYSTVGDKLPIYVCTLPIKKIEVVTNVVCTGGDLDVSLEDIAVLDMDIP